MPEVPDTVDDAIDPLVSPSTDEVFEATRPFSAREIASAAASEALTGGGGGTPAGNDKEIQFNDADAFGADPNFVWDAPSRTLLLVNVEDGSATITGNAPGVLLSITAADGTDLLTGGELLLGSGASDGAAGGDVTITAGGDSGDATGGNVTIASGRSAEGDAGEIGIRANPGGESGGQGGQVVIAGGPGASGGGDVIIQAGGADGSVQAYSGDSNQYLQLDNDGLQVGATKLGFYQGAAVVQPVVPLTTPTVQDVIDALVALGLVAQHD